MRVSAPSGHSIGWAVFGMGAGGTLTFIVQLSLESDRLILNRLINSVRPRESGDPGFAAKTGFPHPRERTGDASVQNNHALTSLAGRGGGVPPRADVAGQLVIAFHDVERQPIALLGVGNAKVARLVA